MGQKEYAIIEEFRKWFRVMKIELELDVPDGDAVSRLLNHITLPKRAISKDSSAMRHVSRHR